MGLIVYAGESYTKTPITSDKQMVKNTMNKINFDGVIDDGTAIGIGLATAVNRLKGSRAKSKVIILLTDGVNNSGFIDPKIAAEVNLILKPIPLELLLMETLELQLEFCKRKISIRNYQSWK